MERAEGLQQCPRRAFLPNPREYRGALTPVASSPRRWGDRRRTRQNRQN